MIIPIGNRLLVEPIKETLTTAGGFILKDPDTLATTKCTIVGLGTELIRKWNIGDIVLVPKQSFIEVREDPLDITVAISEDDVIAVITPVNTHE